jgi:PAS domain S-box-containing protein
MHDFRNIIPDETWRRALFDESPVPAAFVDLDGVFREVNDAYSAITGYGRRELLGRTWQSITHPDDVEPDAGGVEDLVAGYRDAYQLDKRYITKAGRSLLGTLHGVAIRDDKELLGFYVVFVPIFPDTDRVVYSTRNRQVVYEANHVKSPWQWAARFPTHATVGLLGLAFLLGADRLVTLLMSFFP